MINYSIEPRNCIFAKGYGFLSPNIWVKSLIKTNAEQSATYAL